MQGGVHSNIIPWMQPANQLWVGVYFESLGLTSFHDKEGFNLTLGFKADSDFHSNIMKDYLPMHITLKSLRSTSLRPRMHPISSVRVDLKLQDGNYRLDP